MSAGEFFQWCVDASILKRLQPSQITAILKSGVTRCRLHGNIPPIRKKILRNKLKQISCSLLASTLLFSASTVANANTEIVETITANSDSLQLAPTTLSALEPSISVANQNPFRPIETTVNTEEVAGGQQTTFIIENPESHHAKTFDFNLGNDAHIEEIDGFFFIVENEEPVIRISSPWAKDALGNDVKTWFTTDGTTLTQHVEPDENTVYPIEADPRWTWGNISGHVYFSKEETRKVAGGAAGAAAVGPFWLAVPPPFGAAIAGWWAKNTIHVTETATRAVASGKCVQLKVGYIGVAGGAIGVEPAEYTEGCA